MFARMLTVSSILFAACMPAHAQNCAQVNMQVFFYTEAQEHCGLVDIPTSALQQQCFNSLGGLAATSAQEGAASFDKYLADKGVDAACSMAMVIGKHLRAE